MNKPRLLVVDDDPKVSNLIAVILRRCGGCEVLEENRSFRALAMATEWRPDLILLDVDMPGKAGGELAAEMSRHPSLRGVPVLFVTSLVAAREAAGACVKRGEHYFISKPVLPNLLVKTVREILQTGVPAAALA